MKALIPGFALLTFIAAVALPIGSHAQTAPPGGTSTMAPDTGSAPTSSAKKSRHSSRSHHAKKRTKKPSTSQTSSAAHLLDHS